MDVNFPMPVGEDIMFFEKDITGNPTKEELEAILSDAEEKIARGCEELKSGEYRILDYVAVFLDKEANRTIHGCIMGGCDLSLAGPNYSDDLKQRFFESFQHLREAYKETPFIIEGRIHLLASRDAKITKIEAQNPFA
jgi:hypothetical protein